MIRYIEREDIGLYHCKTVHNGQEYLLTSYALRVDVSFLFTPQIEDFLIDFLNAILH